MRASFGPAHRLSAAWPRYLEVSVPVLRAAMRVAWACLAGVGDTLSLSQPRSRIYHDHGVLFCWPDGRPPHPDTITRRSKQLAAAAGLPEIDLHGVRHSYATAGQLVGTERSTRRRLASGSVTQTWRSR